MLGYIITGILCGTFGLILGGLLSSAKQADKEMGISE